MKRRLHLTEGNSDKFWYIDVTEDHVTVRYGRSGTAGTTRTKQYESADKALTDAKKQVAAKLRKGYTDDATASAEKLEPAEATRTGEKNETGAAERVVAEPVNVPLEVSDLDADDLGLVITPFERAYDINAEVSIDLDDSPFDPEAELERAECIVVFEPYSDGYTRMQRLRFTEPPFNKMPSRERLAWWAKHLKWWSKHLWQLHNPKKRLSSWQDSTADWPSWLRVLLCTDWDAPTSRIANDLGATTADALVLRAVLETREQAEVEEARAKLPSPLPSIIGRNNYGAQDLVDTTVFAAAGLDALDPDEARKLLGEVPKNMFSVVHHRGEDLAGLILPTPEERVAFTRHAGASVTDWRRVVPWLVATGRKGFGPLIGWLDQVSKEASNAMLSAAADAGHGPGMAELFLDALGSKAADVAVNWIRSHMPQVLAANLTRAQAELLAPFLRELPGEQLRGIADQARGNTRIIVDEILTELTVPPLPADTAWWVEAVETTKLPKASKLPFSVAGLPPILVDGFRLDTVHVETLLQALSDSTRNPLISAVRDRADRISRDRFALALFKLWLAAGAPTDLSWLMTGAGYLGDSRFVNALAPLVRQWPGISQHKRAVKGLTALRNVASDEALQQISGIAAKVKYTALKQHANQAMREIALRRGLTRDELEDRIIPDGGLDERGSRVFDYGTRRFLAYVTPEGKLAARLLNTEGHPTGKVLSTLPAPNKSDNPEQAKTAKAEYNLVKKTVTALTKIQIKRFEQAMFQDRRWAPEDHARFITPHPVLRRLLAGIIWGVYDAENALVATARIDEDGRLVGPDDEAAETKGSAIGIPHPLEMDDATRATWAAVLSDYEIVQSFKQLDRTIFRLPADQGDDTKLHALPEGRFPAGKLAGAFTKYGWERGSALDNGVYCIHAMAIPTTDLTAVIRYTGMMMGFSFAEQEDQELEEAYILKGHHDPKNLGWGNELDTRGLERVPGNQVPPKAVSEILATLETIRS